VATISVGYVFENKRAMSSSRVLFTILNSSLYCEHIHSVDLETRNILTTLVIVGKSRRAVGGGTHSILVVYKDLVSKSN
jgi:hypothetical protein